MAYSKDAEDDAPKKKWLNGVHKLALWEGKVQHISVAILCYN